MAAGLYRKAQRMEWGGLQHAIQPAEITIIVLAAGTQVSRTSFLLEKIH